MIGRRVRVTREAKPRTLLPRGTLKDWSYEQINETEYVLRLRTPIAQTGSGFNSDYAIPLHHRVKELTAYHYDSTGSTLSTDLLTFKWYTQDGDNWRLRFNETNAPYTSFTISYLDEVNGGVDINPGTHRFYTDTTNTDKVAISMYIEVIHR